MTFLFEHRADGRRQAVFVPDASVFPMIEATHKLASLTGYADDWELIDIERYTDDLE